ncbi:MAG TPA: hypothetical protein VM238_18425 [Phycisphaerae bacterium]|nr:hypothetical protein [Phycisphaerae bacterium]
MPFRHEFVSAKADGGDTTKVRPLSNWNDDHVMAVYDGVPSGAANSQVWFSELPEHTVDGNTMGLWHLHNRVWTDGTDNDYDLTTYNAPTFVNGGASFVASSVGAFSQWAKATTFPNIRGKTQFTNEAWLYLTSNLVNNDYRPISAQYYNTRLRLYKTGGTTKLEGYAYASVTGLVTVTYTFPADPATMTWHHAAMTYEVNAASGAKLWWGGSNVKRSAGTTPNEEFKFTSTGLWVARDADNYSWNGYLDEIRFSDTVRYAALFTPTRASNPILRAKRSGVIYQTVLETMP